MGKKITTDELAGMVQHGLAEIGERVNRGFIKNEEEHSEIVSILREILTEIRVTRGDVVEIKATVKGLADVAELKNRIERLENQVGI